MSSARRTLHLALWSIALAWATQRINLTRSLGPNYSLESRRLHNRVRGTSAVPSECERDAHRRPAATSISQHEETGNSRLCNLPISAGFFLLLLSA
jgi:hypothetical protein